MSECDPQFFQAVEVVGVAVVGFAHEREVGEALEEEGKSYLHFQPRQGCADAEMDAGAEADVRVGLA